jgi:hypothetical protein
MIDRKRTVLNLLVIFAATVALAGSALAATDACVSANVPGPIVLPDGTFYPAGQIRICLTERLSPVAGLHETSIGGIPVGMFLSRSNRTEASPSDQPEPVFQFMRTERGVWILTAYSIAEGKRVVVYQLRPAVPHPAPSESDRASAGMPEVLTAALGR